MPHLADRLVIFIDYPAPAELFRHLGSYAAAGEWIPNYVILVGKKANHDVR